MLLPFLDSYDGQTTDELLSLEGAYRTDSLVLAFEQAIQLKGALTENETFVLAVEALEREVNNGGYRQFFFNSSVEFAGIVEAALRAIGCPRTAEITRDALAVMARATSGDLSPGALTDAAGSEDAALEAALTACDRRYDQTDEAIAQRLFEWIKANRGAIRIGSSSGKNRII